ncbi:hypothetical protein DPMN_051935 [Dreissena polymorpha]|uniref:Uncharacterized protein n=1 Tax=Dreissena polymorpha TaxID=45954 RepID=A0A9D4CIR4_DREPO|nr:hypothetical protein DPMN_051935 [Dreissena polymorpha]
MSEVPWSTSCMVPGGEGPQEKDLLHTCGSGRSYVARTGPVKDRGPVNRPVIKLPMMLPGKDLSMAGAIWSGVDRRVAEATWSTSPGKDPCMAGAIWSDVDRGVARATR